MAKKRVWKRHKVKSISTNHYTCHLVRPITVDRMVMKINSSTLKSKPNKRLSLFLTLNQIIISYIASFIWTRKKFNEKINEESEENVPSTITKNILTYEWTTKGKHFWISKQVLRFDDWKSKWSSFLICFHKNNKEEEM